MAKNLGFFKIGTDVFENIGGGQQRKIEQPEFQKLGINFDFLGEGLPQTKTIDLLTEKKPTPTAPAPPVAPTPTAPTPTAPTAPLAPTLTPPTDTAGEITGVTRRGDDFFVTAGGVERPLGQEEFQSLGINETFVQSGQTVSLQQATSGQITPSTAKPIAEAFKGVSVVDFLASQGQDSSFASRSKLAADLGIENYRGTAAQNTQLLNLLQAGTQPPTEAPPVAPTGEVAPEAPTPDVEAAKATAEEEANATAKAIFENLKAEDLEEGTRASTKLLADLETKAIEGAPTPPSLAELFTAKREELGIAPLEDRMAAIDSEIEELQTALTVEAQKAGERLVSTREIGRRKGTLQQEFDQRKAFLDIERSSIARELNNKLSTLETVVNLTGTDFTNASRIYEQEFNRNLKLLDLTIGIENKEEANAQANLNTIINLAQSSGVGVADLSPTIRANINNLELQQGLPVGITESFIQAKPNTNILSTVKGTDAQGNEIVTFVYEDLATGKPGVVEIVETGGFTDPTRKTTPTTTDINVAQLPGIESRLIASKGEDGFVDPAIYSDERAKARISASEFDKRFKHLLSPQEQVKLGIIKSSDSDSDSSDLIKRLEGLAK